MGKARISIGWLLLILFLVFFGHQKNHVEASPYSRIKEACEQHGNKSDSSKCRKILQQFSEAHLRCNISKLCEPCKLDSGFIHYLRFQYCYFSERILPTFLMVIWLIILLMCFATIADGFFSPCLIALARTLRMNQNLAGVTLLAFGNGAPDVFTAVTAITSRGPYDPDEGLGLGFLLGSGLLVNSVTAGLVILIKPFCMSRRPFLKDTFFYIIAVSWSAHILIKKEMTLASSIGFLCLYCIYVLTTWAGSTFLHKMDPLNNTLIQKIISKFCPNLFRKTGKSTSSIPLDALANTSSNNRSDNNPDSNRAGGQTNPVFQISEFEDADGVGDGKSQQPMQRQRSGTEPSKYRGSQRRRAHSKAVNMDPKLPYLVRWIIAHEEDDEEEDDKSDNGEPKIVPTETVQRKASIKEKNHLSPQPKSDRRRRASSLITPRVNFAEIDVKTLVPPPYNQVEKIEEEKDMPSLKQITTDLSEIMPQVSAKPVEARFCAPKGNDDKYDITIIGMATDKTRSKLQTLEEWACRNMWNHFIYTLIPVELKNWYGKGVVLKLFQLIRCPLIFIFRATIPIVLEDLMDNETCESGKTSEIGDKVTSPYENTSQSSEPTEDIFFSTEHVLDEESMHGWCKILNCLHCIICPTLWVMLISGRGTSYGFNYIGNTSFPIFGLAMLIGSVTSVIVFFTSRWYKPPSFYHRPFFALMGFVTSIIWIYALAHELVNSLETLGIVWNISEAILGLTVMALASSIGDIMSNCLLAKNGYPRIAYSACIGAPLFNLLIGAGIPYTIKIVSKHGDPALFSFTLNQALLFALLLVILVSNVIVAMFCRWRLPRWYGGSLIAVYIVFVIIAILVEVDIIVPPKSWKLLTGVE